MKKILLVFGTRPEAIKMAPLVKKFKEESAFFDCKVCVTAQHREMLDQVLQWFEISPDYDLNIMRPGQDLYDITANVLSGMKDVLKDYQPDAVLVHGDTTTSFATALAAFYQQIPVGHIEAGLRTYNLDAPFPEELNRQLTGRMARWHFVPTSLNRDNLLSEGVKEQNIYLTGNTVIDALYWTTDKIKRQSLSGGNVDQNVITVLNDPSIQTVLVTAHRRESFGHGFVNICEALAKLAQTHKNLAIIYPVHPNPKVKEPVEKYLKDIPNIHLIEPLNYQDFVFVMEAADIVLTDSGGVQEEAPSLGKPVLVMRDVTERVEALEGGTVELVGTDVKKIVDRISHYLAPENNFISKVNPYGDGKAVQRIVETFKGYFNS
ncbi:non-hydrolyzing UDP-N-acetylglucosamine 2-epimerase [Chitinophaga pinensis]|uniref:UDP-N-acetylglucosamine 2-epimerase (non-hydrolyzing) n=1 Tax=Chitinophaga pinensis (strain ATCC 43595 / DSM 2588 / LMG 13176 / NBRC 15968 / NCIMB 11800 / UQM 2034) TaxID=485918 RepID=A0A979G0I4_CHIPD|nr:UDP-N-acetylglucosamine 2-epimerase (non-hydrolyzing) [Chitinophaga pinensis]ACU58584.1 UDP-N-acetylglucosamine 2-epimerase [Chitinophaga pinensis DSM 2588]